VKNSYQNIDFTDFNNYRIDVSGKLDENLSDIFGGLSISHKIEGDKTISYLEGEIIDQSELVGIINTLHNMRFNILSLKILNQTTA
jgi:hypothetical protein